jgi:hypothetical protein
MTLEPIGNVIACAWWSLLLTGLAIGMQNGFLTSRVMQLVAHTPAFTHDAAQARRTRIMRRVAHTPAFTHDAAQAKRSNGMRRAICAPVFTQVMPQARRSKKKLNAFRSAFRQSLLSWRNRRKKFLSTSTQLWRTRVRVFLCIPDEGLEMTTHWLQCRGKT